MTPCALHDSQNAFRWGQLQDFNDKFLMRDLYVAVQSLRNSADLVSSSVCGWVVPRLRFVAGRDEAWLSEKRQLWEALGVDVETASVMVEDLQLSWEGDSFMIWDSYQAHYHLCKHPSAKQPSVLFFYRRPIGLVELSYIECTNKCLQIGDRDLAESVSACLMSVWRFRKFSESRWLTLGTTCRTLVAAVATEFDNLFRYIQQDTWSGL